MDEDDEDMIGWEGDYMLCVERTVVSVLLLFVAVLS